MFQCNTSKILQFPILVKLSPQHKKSLVKSLFTLDLILLWHPLSFLYTLIHSVQWLYMIYLTVTVWQRCLHTTIVSIPASSAPVERTFSSGGIIMSPIIANLSSFTLEVLMFLICSKHVLPTPKNGNQEHWFTVHKVKVTLKETFDSISQGNAYLKRFWDARLCKVQFWTVKYNCFRLLSVWMFIDLWIYEFSDLQEFTCNIQK